MKNKVSKKVIEKYKENLVKETINDFNNRQIERKPIEAQWLLNMNFL